MYFHEGSGYGILVVGMYVIMHLWSSLVQQEGSEDDTWLGLLAFLVAYIANAYDRVSQAIIIGAAIFFIGV